MTPDEMGKALGDGWTWCAPLKRFEHGNGTLLERTGNGKWVVSFRRLTVRPEVVVPVAHLLVAAEQIAGGAEVAPREETALFACEFAPPDVRRRHAIDLLRTAAEAEEQG